jgi:Ca2+-binding RTX toxin-like protein
VGPIVINLTTGQAEGAVGRKTFTSIEKANGGTADDTLIGNDEDNVLQGQDGNDHLEGRGCDDWLLGGFPPNAFVDFLDGDDGSDRCEFGTTILNCELP